MYVVIIALIVLIIGIFVYFNKKINNLNNHSEMNSQMIINVAQRINKMVELNYLDDGNYKYLINPKNWKELLKKETALDLNDLAKYQIDNVIVRQKKDMQEDDLSEYTVLINIMDDASFNDFTKLMYQKINNVLIYTGNDTSKVESFKEGRGYYDIASFEEATYNNMYYDYMKKLSDGSTGGPKVKIKILYLEETNQIKMEINKF